MQNSTIAAFEGRPPYGIHQTYRISCADKYHDEWEVKEVPPVPAEQATAKIS
jgi:hypothetical protein